MQQKNIALESGTIFPEDIAQAVIAISSRWNAIGGRKMPFKVLLNCRTLSNGNERTF
jgi:hypothetical protein